MTEHTYLAMPIERLRELPLTVTPFVGRGRCAACGREVFWHNPTMENATKIVGKIGGQLRIVCDGCAESEKVLQGSNVVVVPDLPNCLKIHGED